ncbi:MAG: hypothetical protein KDD69_11580, partial [Bdellovibrionales bacterium]|nr:hypothetical protein [Bdellovibrionales bacterium]
MNNDLRTLQVLGIDYHTAALEVREAFSLDESASRSLLGQARSIPGLAEALILSTCNRTEFYLVAERGEQMATIADAWLNLLRTFRPQAPVHGRGLAFYHHADDSAVRHLLRVACGLESALLGDVNIHGQLKQAFNLARQCESVGPL